MDHYDLKHSTQEDIIEFEVLDNISNNKKLHFKDGEAVKIISAGSNYAIGTLSDDKIAMVKPVNAHYQSVVEGILGRGRVYLAAVINHTKKLLQVSFKQYAEEKNLSYAINVSEDFFALLRKSVNLNNPYNPKDEIASSTLYEAGGYTYAIVGTHIRANEEQRFKQFLIAGKEYYIQVNKILEDLGQEYYVAEKILKNI